MIKALIVDDSPDLLQAVKYVLNRHGCIVKTLISTNEIYEEICEFQPQVLILDLYLAAANGRDICTDIRKRAGTENLGILVWSVSPESLEDYKSFGADDFIEKPFALTSLLEKIKSVANCRSLLTL